MTKKKARASTQKIPPDQALSLMCGHAHSLLLALKQPATVLFTAADESAQIGARLRKKTGDYRAMKKAEKAYCEHQVLHYKRLIHWDVIPLIRSCINFEWSYTPVAQVVSRLYQPGSPAVRMWDVYGMSGMDALNQLARQTVLGLFGFDYGVFETVEKSGLSDAETEAALVAKMFQYWPGHMYRQWEGRNIDDLGELGIRLRREELALLGTDLSGSRTDDEPNNDLPDVSTRGAPTEPTEPMPVKQRARQMGMDRRTMRDAMMNGVYRFRRVKPYRFEF